MKAVNLLPTDLATAKRSVEIPQERKRLLIGAGAVSALVIAGLSSMVWLSSSSLDDKSKRLEALKSQIASTPNDSTLQAALGTRKSTVTSLVANRLAWDQFLGALSKVMPEDVWLENLQSTTPGAAATIATAQAAAAAASAAATAKPTGSSTTTTPPPAAPRALPSTFTISGFTYSQPSVARMMRRLSIVPWLTGITLVSSSKTSVGPDTVYQFTLKASLVSPQAMP